MTSLLKNCLFVYRLVFIYIIFLRQSSLGSRRVFTGFEDLCDIAVMLLFPSLFLFYLFP